MVKIKLEPLTPLDPMFRESPTRSTPKQPSAPTPEWTTGLRDKSGNPVPDAAFDSGYEGPLDRENPVEKSLGPDFEREFWAKIDAEIAAEEQAASKKKD
jgi:hypothetical protein